MIKKNKIFKYLAIFLIVLGIASFRFVLAQYGVDEVGGELDDRLGETNTDPRSLATRIINISLGFLGIIALLIILYAGFLWMTSGGNEEKIAKAKKTLIAGVIGLVIILSSWGLASWLIKTISNTTSGGENWGYDSGDIESCGCGGYMVFENGSWGPCIGSDCSGPGNNEPETCDGSGFLAGCQAVQQICAEGSYCNDECLCVPLGQAGDSCNLSNNESVCQADDSLCGQYLTCNPESCVCEGSPVITGITPVGGFCQNEHNKSCQSDDDCTDTCNVNAPNGAANNFLTISGKNFGTFDPDLSRVVFVGSGSEKEGVSPDVINPECISFWRNDQIIIAIPEGAGTGPIRVESFEGKSDSTNDEYGPVIPDFRSNSIVRPGLCEIDPVRGKLSSEVSYSGINLYQGAAYFGNYTSNVKALVSEFNDQRGLSGVSVTPNIKAGQSGSFVRATISGNTENSNYLTFIKEREENEGAFISSFSPTSGNTGQYVTIYGSGFENRKADSKVYFGEVEASYDFPEVCLNSVWRDNQITVKVPAGLEDGDHTIRIDFNDKSINSEDLNPNAFEFDKNLELKTSMCKIDPLRGSINTDVSIWGEYFGKDGSEVSIKFNGSSENQVSIVEKDGRADLLKTQVPAGSITGPVRVIKNSNYGNELNFSVGKCVSNSDCGQQVCCPNGTFKEGSCVDSFANCYVDIPSSVYEWNFSTSFSVPEIEADSCAGLSKTFGFCNIESSCPNVPGMCSPYLGGEKVYGADCSYDCSSVLGCRVGENNCIYNENIDKCVQILDGELSNNCNLEKEIEYDFNGELISTTAKCNANGNWEVNVKTTCPEGYIKGLGDVCYDPNSQCLNCQYGLNCQLVNGYERCVSSELCPADAVCESENGLSNGRCVSTSDASCDCCCTIGQSERDCCSFLTESGELAQLECAGTCGSDTTDNGSGYGVCSGCASAGSSTELRDAACNCTGHSGQYCEVNSSAPSGFCTDCSSLSPDACVEHADVCCLDSKGTADTSDDICRGGVGNLITDDEASEDYGYCAYFNCSETENTCATSTPFKFGSFLDTNKCISECSDVDPCSGITGFDDCINQASGRCCFDSSSNSCSLGTKINNGSENDGYCAYYNCSEEGNSCAANTPLLSGAYDSLDDCFSSCQNPASGMGLMCFRGSKERSETTCDTSLCTADGFSCMTEEGSLGSTSINDCGTCCCQPVVNSGAVDSCQLVNENLSCVANQGKCSGEARGLCCGCSSDDQCGSTNNIGCGLDTCCNARPEVVSTMPEHLDDNVCRNASLRVEFNQLMDGTKLINNVILIEEKINSSEPCPLGTFIAKADSIDNALNKKPNLLTKISYFFKNTYKKIASIISPSFSQRVFASMPSEDNLYCLVPGKASLQNTENSSTVVFNSDSLLEASTNYYLVVKGDEDLNSNTGILSLNGIGFNGYGYLDGDDYKEGEGIKFNEVSYKNSHIIKFSTISDQETSGICLIDSVKIEPSSYLFNTTDNELESNESDVYGNNTFDSKPDKDKVWTLNAYSDNQIIRPVSAYFWTYNFAINNEEIASGKKLENMPENQYFVSAKEGITDGKTKIQASINMDNFNPENSSCDSSATCVCSDSICSENCCNTYLKGDGFSDIGNIYVFVCSNPWPEKDISGIWSPWIDSDDNCSVGDGNCNDYNYSFYYCRDLGKDGSYDDLPAILNSPIIIGQNNNLVCSSDGSVDCGSVNQPCGSDVNGDGFLDGICIWSVLKESYFFRESLPSSGEITSISDMETGGQIRIDWQSDSSQVASYKIYYIKSGDNKVSAKEVALNACDLSDNKYSCSVIVTGLENDKNYSFRIGVISENGAESQAVNERVVMPTDKTAPQSPQNLEVSEENDQVKISWTENEDDTYFYRLYMGTRSALYGKSFDTNYKSGDQSLNSLLIPKEEFSSSDNYLSLTAFDKYNNESAKSQEIIFSFDSE